MRQLQRVLMGPQRLARLLAGEGQYVPAAEEFLAADQPLDAARMYEAAGEYALASETFRDQGFLLDAARTLALAGDQNAAAELYRQGGDLLQAGRAFARASNHLPAAQTFEQIEAWAEAADQWQALESWERAAAAWERAGKGINAALAWERAGEQLRAAECYCQVAEETEQTGGGDKEASALYERAMQAYARCGAQRRATYCDRKRRYLRKQPWLEINVVSAGDLVVGVRSKLVITVTNSGWGDAARVLVSAATLSGNEPVHSHAREFGLGRGLNRSEYLYAIPYHPGQLAVDVSISYQDIFGNDYPALEQTVDLEVKERETPRGVTPAEIHVHGHYFAGQVQEVISDGVKIERHAAPGPSSPAAAPVAAHTVECARCQRHAPADAAACPHCGTPFIACRYCGLSLPRRMKHCMHCGQAL
jgi:tetratricopeptide (TPR) repeat protein